jgi:SAM-dependent methyltransferase
MSGDIKQIVRDKYGEAARRVIADGAAPSCCGTGSSCCDPTTSDLYETGQTQGLPEAALLASPGCGNPTALAELKPGEVVLDLGSGGGIDVLLSAQRAGPTGKAYGLDMTDDMLALANDNKRKAGATNVEFLRGEIEPAIRRSNLAWVGCVALALDEQVYRGKVVAAGFRDVDVEPTRIYTLDDAAEFVAANGLAPQADGRFFSAFVRATEPAG